MQSKLLKGCPDFGSVWHTHAMEGERRPRPKMIQRLELRRATHRERHLLFRFLFGVTGSVVLAAGLVMLVTPGPAFVLIPIGLAMLSMEFVWAERLLDKSLEQAAKAQQKAAETTTKQRVLVAIATALAIAAAGLAVLWWDIPLLPDN
jgi:uncharacterized protein (TIGR02611 family)